MKFLKENQEREKEYLEYEDLPIIIYGEERDYDDWDQREEEIEWTYVVDKSDVEEFIADDILPLVLSNKQIEDMAESDIYNYIKEHYEELVEKYYDKILNHFREDAIEDAQENNDLDYVDEYSEADDAYDRDRYFDEV